MDEKNLPSRNPYSSISASIIIGSLMISLSILLSNGVIRVDNGKITLQSPSAAQQTLVPDSPNPQAEVPEEIGPVDVELSDAPIIGDKNATLTMVEFSDYECPFCKSYFDSTWPQIKKNYVDTGKLKIVFRNLPLPFHQNAHKEAQAALCVRDQGGDSGYFRYHDEIFTRTTSNGLGFALDKLAPLAAELEYNATQIQQCLDSNKYKEKIDQDISYANSVGATGTPTFFIGKSSNSGKITGTKIVGAQPYTSFQSTLDSLLK